MANDLVVAEQIGEGRYATVFKGKHCGTDVAVKVVGYHINVEERKLIAEDPNFPNEIKKMEKCKHENIVQYTKTVSGGVTLRGVTFPALVMTLMKTDLKSFLRNQQAPLLPHKEVKIAHDIAKALHYLHDEAGLFHGDLHCGNVLLSQITAVEGPSVKLCDFGFTKSISSILQEEGEESGGEAASSYVYQQQSKFKLDSAAYDIWLFGVVMWNIHILPGLNDEKPSACIGLEEDLEQIQGRKLYEAVEKCWHEKQPSKAERIVKILEMLKSQTPVEDPKDIKIEDLRKQIAKLKAQLQNTRE